MNKDPSPPREATNTPGDEVAPGSQQSGENLCRQCDGSGRLADRVCPECRGTGKVTVLIGDA
jgi:DnaJ-class molecular chaperone